MLKRFSLYALRWQLSTPIMVPILAFCTGHLGTNLTIATIVANFIGAFIFFWVDKYIFRPRMDNPFWEVKEETECSLCGKQCRGYRLFKAKNYDRTDDKNPEFLCEDCSRQQVEQLKSRGVKIS